MWWKPKPPPVWRVYFRTDRGAWEWLGDFQGDEEVAWDCGKAWLVLRKERNLGEPNYGELVVTQVTSRLLPQTV